MDVNAENDSGWNSILPAFLGGHLKIVKSLLDNVWGNTYRANDAYGKETRLPMRQIKKELRELL